MTLTHKQQYTDTTAALRTDSLPCAQGGSLAALGRWRNMLLNRC